MRKNAITLLSLAFAAILASPALATPLMSETFSYPNGNLVPNGGWATHSGTTGADIQVVSGAAAGDMAQALDDNRTFVAQDSLATTYACFRVMIPNPGVGALRTNYFAHFKDTGTFNFVGRLFVASQGTTFSFGLSSFSSTMQAQWATALNYDQWYTVVIKYSGSTDTSVLWVDPLFESDPSISATSATPLYPNPQSVAVSAFALRQSSTGTALTWKYNVDNLGVGTTFDDACTSGPTSTQSSTWGRLKAIYR